MVMANTDKGLVITVEVTWSFYGNEDRQFFRVMGRLSGVLLIALSLGTGFCAAGLLKGRTWAWRFAVGLFAANICGDVAGVFFTRDPLRAVMGVLVASVFLLVLARRSVRLFFDSSRRPCRP